jgi:hypothetical protein
MTDVQTGDHAQNFDERSAGQIVVAMQKEPGAETVG